jgi:uncharacterized membrane protein
MRVLPLTAVLLLMGNVVAAGVPPPTAPESEAACPIAETEKVKVIEKSVSIDRAPETVYAFWRDPSHLPEFMEHVQSVEVLDPNRSRWVVTGPMGIRVQWNVQVLSETAPHDMAWCTRENERVRYQGSVRFKSDASAGTTEATLRLKLRLPDAPIRVAMALTGWDPETEVETSLQRLKELLERPTN